MEEVNAATARLLSTVGRLDAGSLVEPSLLPGWTLAHVLTHLARNADGHVHLLNGAREGELRTQYSSSQARADAIEMGAQRPGQAIIDDLIRACAAWAERAAELPATAWEAPVQPLGRDPRPASQLRWARLREVEVHHVDLASPTYGIEDWSSRFAGRLLDEIAATFRTRGETPGFRLVADNVNNSWSTGRSEAVEVHGPVRSLAGWLAGRSEGFDLRTRDGTRLPSPPPWA